jgi:hypothetical protein
MRPLTALFTATLLLTTLAFAKDKKNAIPAYILNAHTVSVIIDPHAGVSIEDPEANQVAQKDVQAALARWGRYDLRLIAEYSSDLIIVIRRGERNVQQTIVDPRQGSHPVSVTPTDDGMSVGVQRGQQPNAPGMPTRESSPDTPHTQMEISDAEDSFEVYQGNVSNPLDTAPGFRSRAKDGLHPHNVPAVDVFKKAVTDAEKAAAQNSGSKHP